MAQSVQIKRVHPWMERMADFLIAQPGIGLTELSAQMGKTTTWISIVKNSDTFQDYWRERSRSHSEAVTLTIKDKAFAAAELALDAVNQRLERDAAILPIDTHLNIIDTTMRRFGYGSGGAQGTAPQINFNFNGVSPDMLERARDKMRGNTVQVETLETVVVEPSRAIEAEQQLPRPVPGDKE